MYSYMYIFVYIHGVSSTTCIVGTMIVTAVYRDIHWCSNIYWCGAVGASALGLATMCSSDVNDVALSPWLNDHIATYVHKHANINN